MRPQNGESVGAIRPLLPLGIQGPGSLGPASNEIPWTRGWEVPNSKASNPKGWEGSAQRSDFAHSMSRRPAEAHDPADGFRGLAPLQLQGFVEEPGGVGQTFNGERRIPRELLSLDQTGADPAGRDVALLLTAEESAVSQ